MAVDIRPMREEDREQVVRLHAQAFNLPAEDFPRLNAIPCDEVRVAAEGDTIRASLRVPRMGQFFGGRAVPCATVAAVEVAPEARSRGFGSALVREVHQELHRDGVALATLYPSAPRVYRKAGYEFAGVRTRYTANLADLSVQGDAACEPWDDGDLEEVDACYRRYAAVSNGLLERPHHWWNEKILGKLSSVPIYRYVFRRSGEVTGYIIFTHQVDHEAGPYHYRLECRDFVWTDAQTGKALLGFAAGHRALAPSVSWSGPPTEPLGGFFENDLFRVSGTQPWMLRLVSVTEALEARGYPAGLDRTIDLSIADSVITENAGQFRITISNGTAKVERTDSARASIDVGALAAIYSGWWSAHDAVRVGRLENATSDDVSVLDTIFAGPKPWMSEIF